jgi:hypothetical protein
MDQAPSTVDYLLTLTFELTAVIGSFNQAISCGYFTYTTTQFLVLTSRKLHSLAESAILQCLLKVDKEMEVLFT